MTTAKSLSSPDCYGYVNSTRTVTSYRWRRFKRTLVVMKLYLLKTIRSTPGGDYETYVAITFIAGGYCLYAG